MTKDEALKLALEALENNKQNHNYCEDTWYSCPKHEEGCANDAEGDECNCGADKANAEIDKAIATIKEALAQPEQKPVAMRYDFNGYGYSYIDNGSNSNWREKIKNAEPLYTAPSQRTWVELTDKEIDLLNYVQVEGCQCSLCYIDGVEEFARAIEAKLREKNGC